MATPPDGTAPTMQMYLQHEPGTTSPGERPVLADQRRRRGRHRLPRVHPRPVQPAGRRRARQLDARRRPGRRDGRGLERLVRHGLPGRPGPAARTPAAHGDVARRRVRRRRRRPDPHRADRLPGRLDVAALPRHAGHGPGGYTYGDFGKIIGGPEVHADGEIWGADAVGPARRARLEARPSRW